MKLVVGLGNPGRKYAGTRHNVGFEVLAELARRLGGGRTRHQFHGETLSVTVDDQPVLLLWPQTYMNRSGQSVLAARDFYKLPTADLLVVCDDFNLPLGRLRFRPRGSSGGQKGLEDIIARLGTEEVPRLRIGIGPLPEGADPSNFVLGRFPQEQLEDVRQVIERAADGVMAWVKQGIQYCMNHYNAR